MNTPLRNTPLRLSLVLATAAAALGGCAQTSSPAASAAAKPAAVQRASSPSVLDVAARDPQLSTFVKLARDAGLADTLAAAGTYTVLAPSNDAFQALPTSTRDAWSADPSALKTLLSYHVLPARLLAADLKPGKVKTLQGDELVTGSTAGYATVGDALVTQPDLAATNGVVQVIDRVLVPPKK